MSTGLWSGQTNSYDLPVLQLGGLALPNVSGSVTAILTSGFISVSISASSMSPGACYVKTGVWYTLGSLVVLNFFKLRTLSEILNHYIQGK